MANVLDDLTTRFKSFSDTLDKSLLIDGMPFFMGPQRPKGSVASDRRLQGGSRLDASPPTKSRKEREEQAELILALLSPAYFDQAFDPLEHELRQMSDDTKQDEIDGVVEKLSAAMEVRRGGCFALPPQVPASQHAGLYGPDTALTQ